MSRIAQTILHSHSPFLDLRIAADRESWEIGRSKLEYLGGRRKAVSFIAMTGPRLAVSENILKRYPI